jgi:hypothetical protein
MAENLRYNDTSKQTSEAIGTEVDRMMAYTQTMRKQYERKWYDNHFFDDGHHFRYVSRTTGRIVDLSEKGKNYNPQRAIPKASRQIRGMINLLLSGALVPVARPVKLTKANFPDPAEYQKAYELSKDIAKRTGHWLQEEMQKKQDMDSKLAYLLTLAALERVAWIQIYPDPVKEKICTVVRDNFDMYYMGNLVEYEDSPYMILAYPKLVSEIKANEYYKPEETAKITPDNKYAHSEIKQAYMQSKLGGGEPSDSATTVIVKEAYLKEYLNDENMPKIRTQEDGERILKGRKKGDPVIRQTHVVGDIAVYDVYTSLPGYPFVPYMYEPGPLWGVALIERFIPQNKSLDVAVSRLERFLNTMTVGVWMKRRGENVEVSNVAGGQMIEYEATPPVQGNVTSPGDGIFKFIGMLESFIEEQGVTTTALGKLPPGVKANAAIESLKASEFANLKVPLDQLKKTIQKVSEKMLDIADNYFVTPQTVEFLNKGEPDYFDIIGRGALETYKRIKKDLPEDVIPLSKDYGVDISIESGLGFTPDGKRQGAKEILELITPFVQQGLIPGEALKQVIEKVIDTYQFGNTAEFGEALEGMSDKTAPMTDQQILQMKVAIAEVLKDANVLGDGASEQRIMEGKIATVEGLKDAGMIKPQEESKPPSQSIPYKELPPEGRVQMAAAAGIELTPDQVITDDERRNAVELQMKDEELQLKQQEHQMKMAQQREGMAMKAHVNQQSMALKEQSTQEGFKLKKKAMKQSIKMKEEMMQQKTQGNTKIDNKGKR